MSTQETVYEGSMHLREDSSLAIVLDPSIFNTKKDYEKDNGSLFLQEEPGLFDTIHRRHPKIWNLYKKLKQQDWDENEFNYAECLAQFATDSPEESAPMIKSLMWQWETDSLAAQNIIPLYAPFITSSDLSAAVIEVGRNEVVHAATYSEIVKYSFPNAKEVMGTVLKDQEPLRRLSAVAKVFSEVKAVGLQVSDGRIARDDPRARDAVMLLVFTLFALERLQFTPSFVITFAYGEAGRYLPIAKSVQKICNDEFSVHVELGREIIRNELSIPIGQESFARIKDRVASVFREIIEAELAWTTGYVFKDGKNMPGLTCDMVVDFLYYSALDVYTEVQLPYPEDLKLVTSNPVDYMGEWVDLNLNQASPQEEKTGNYNIGGFKADAGDIVFDTAGL